MTSRTLRSVVAGLAVATAATLAPLAVRPAAAAVLHSTTVRVRATDSDGHQYAGGTTSPRLSDDGRWLAFSRIGGGTYVKDLRSGRTELVSLTSTGAAANQPSTAVAISSDGNRILFSTASTNMGIGTPTSMDLYLRDLHYRATQRVNLAAQGYVAVKPDQGDLNDNGLLVAFTTTTNHVWAYGIGGGDRWQVDLNPAKVSGNGGASQPRVSSGGNYVAFTSSSSDLVAGDTNFVSDVFFRNLTANATARLSTSSASAQGNAPSSAPTISDDGHYVAFQSDATNLVAGDTNQSTDVFRKDTTSGTVVLVSQKAGVEGDADSAAPDISGNGNHVAFQTRAENFDQRAHDPSGHPDVFTRDVANGFTTLRSDAPSAIANGASTAPSVADGGQDVAFTSDATNFLDGDTNAKPDVYVGHTTEIGLFGGLTQLAKQQAVDFTASVATGDALGLQLENGTLTPTHLIELLAHAPAWAKDREPVARLYQAFFHREPDLGGLNHWVKKHQGGLSLSKVAQEFVKSSEFTTKYGSVDDTKFVTLVYQNVLKRSPDAAGLAHWVKKLQGGMSRGDVMVQFSESSEGKRFLAPEVDSVLVGLAMLGKMPPKVLYEAAAEYQRAGQPEDAAFTYLLSTEYTARIATISS